MSRQAGWLAQIDLYGDCYALCLPLCFLGLDGPRWTLLSVGGVPLCWGGLCRLRLCVGGLAIGRMSIRGHSFFLLGTGDIPDSWLFVLLVPREPPLMFPLLFPLFVRQFGGFLVFLTFSAPFFLDLFPWASQARLVLVVWGAHCWKRVIPGGLYSSRCCRGSPLFPVLSFVAVGRWVIGRPRNGSGGGLLELLLYRFRGFLF